MKMVGIDNVTQIQMDNITQIANVTTPVDFFVKVNWIVFDGWLFFTLLVILWLILIIAAHRRQVARGIEPRILHNMMLSGFPVTLASFMLRAAEIYYLGVRRALLTDYQLWIIPLIMVLIAVTLWITRDND